MKIKKNVKMIIFLETTIFAVKHWYGSRHLLPVGVNKYDCFYQSS